MAPGSSVPDRTEGIPRVEDLPRPLVVSRSRNYRRRVCPHCGRSCYRDGPLCVLLTVDSPTQRRLLCEVLEHDPGHDDIRLFLGRVKSAIAARGRTVRGLTTDGSALYPQPLAEVFPEAPHQVCEFHVLK